MKFRLPLTVFALFTLVSCEQILDNYWENKRRENYVSPYAGTYIGTYSGQDSGTLTIVVSNKDMVTATRNSTKFNKEETFYGGMMGSSLYQVNSRDSGFWINGYFTSQTLTYTGTWSQNGLSGNWTVTKQ